MIVSWSYANKDIESLSVRGIALCEDSATEALSIFFSIRIENLNFW